MKNMFLILAVVTLSALATVAQSSPTATASPSSSAKTDIPPTGLRRNGRTFFIKMSYLFRKSFG
jgi:hypothetical protein